jgi:cyclic pyranopterin phosphate synthase
MADRARRTAKAGAARRLSHIDARGRVQMVDVSDKPETDREAVAEAVVTMSAAARRAIRRREVKKGDPLQTARLAGMLAAKRTADLIPLCHPLPLSHVEVLLKAAPRGYTIRARVRTFGRTGVEMEALVAVSTAALTLYDMLKAVDRAMVIGPVRLLEKRGGRSGHYTLSQKSKVRSQK